jgi:tetratricopeptide (TPR) repeat protein
MSLLSGIIGKLFPRQNAMEQGSVVEEVWMASLSGEKNGRFLSRDEGSYASAYSGGALELVLRKSGLFAWTEAPLYQYGDFGVEAEMAFGEDAPYSSCGLLFRLANETNFYALLVSNRGYVRLDAIFNGKPRTIVAWTECASATAPSFRLRLIARGPHLIAFVNEEWVLEAMDETFRTGYLAFAGQFYDEGLPEGQSSGLSAKSAAAAGPAEARFRLVSLLAESRLAELEAWYYRFTYVEAAGADARCRLASSYFSMGEWLSAAVQLRKAEKLRPLDPEELFLKAEISLRLELHDEAEAAIDACLASGATGVTRDRAVEEKANILYLRGRYPELRAYTRDRLAQDPSNARLWTLAGHACFNLGDYIGAAEEYSRAAALEPEQPLCRMNEARAREQAGDRKGASRAYMAAAKGFFEAEADDDLALAMARVEELEPRQPELAAMKAKLLFRNGKRKEAKAAIDRLIAEGTEDSALHYLAGLLEIDAGKRMKALACFEKAVSREPSYPLYAFRLAESLFLLGRPEAKAAIARALELGPDDGWICNLGAMAILAGATGAASATGTTAGTTGTVLGKNGSTSCLSPEEAAEARRLLEKACRALPEAAEPVINLAELESLSGDHEAALVRLSALPENAAARNQAGNILVRQGRIDEAVREYRRAVRMDPSVTEYLLNLAAAYLEIESFSDAEDCVRKALERDPSPRAYLLAGNIASVYGDWVRAEAAFRVGLEAAPDDAVLLLALARTYLGARKLKKAEECARRLDEIDPERAAAFDREYLETTTESLSCSSCGRIWRIPRDLPAQSGASIRGMPPDDSPAGVCPRCGKVYCIACRKSELQDNRFTCPDCGEALKLSDNRLRWLVRESMKRAGKD